MLHFIAFLYVKPGEEDNFHEYENHALSILKEHGGRILQRIRPSSAAFIEAVDEQPYEIHHLSFESEASFQSFLEDPRRKEKEALRNKSIVRSVIVKGEAIN